MRKKKLFIFFILGGCLLIITGQALSASYEAMAEKIEACFVARKPYPLVSQEITGLTVDQAYEIQASVMRFREQKRDVCMGYLAGLSSPEFQKRFGLTDAVYATAYKSMLRWPGTLYRRNYTRMLVETEIGFRFGKDITEPIQDFKTLKRAVAIVFPAIHVLDFAYPDMKSLRGTDLVATNLATRNILVGKAKSLGAGDLNAVEVKLFYEGQEVSSGIGKMAFGDQWEALKWTVNNVLARGGEVKDGYVVITGCLGKPIPAKLGKYLADYGEFGKIEFEYK
jgi:2-keto-4-pentenoate hydratase